MTVQSAGSLPRVTPAASLKLLEPGRPLGGSSKSSAGNSRGLIEACVGSTFSRCGFRLPRVTPAASLKPRAHRQGRAPDAVFRG